MIVGNNAGHTLNGEGSGAIGFINESNCTRQISNHFVEYLKKDNHKVINCTIEKSSNYLYEAVKKANNQKLDYAVSHHLNCSNDSSANGVEVWIYDMRDTKTYEVANRICIELSKLGLKNRGVKESKQFYWLKNTNSKAILIEYLFCSNKNDVGKYNPQVLAKTVYNAMINKSNVVEKPTESEKPTSPYRYPNGEYSKKAMIVNLTEGNKLNVRSARSTSSEVIRKLVGGSIVKVDYCIDNWFSVWENGECGFIYGEYVKLI